MTGKATRLYPLPQLEIPKGEIHAELALPAPGWRNPQRPYVIINMVSSLDGKTSVGGKASPLGSPTDRQTMRNLRSRVDAVMVGAGTLRAEKLSLGLDDPPGGKQPLAVIATNSGDLALEENLLIGDTQELLVLTAHDAGERPLFHKARRRAIPVDDNGNLDLTEAVRSLKHHHGVDVLLVEGGPGLNHSLVTRNLADELFLTVSPKLVGGNPARTILDGPPLPTQTRPAELRSVHLAPDGLFFRYALATTA